MRSFRVTVSASMAWILVMAGTVAFVPPLVPWIERPMGNLLLATAVADTLFDVFTAPAP
ncbi:hypothetical protein [Tautonia sociabilis]|uniref:hypothetical protein n=1 Tax=Tautonia sociabilis TaxID=2080755 RepID=UPI0013151884|nr:hypothetical protein [Tautonia sociabilis]